MQTIYVFSSEEECKIIVHLIENLETLRSKPIHLIYFDMSLKSYELYKPLTVPFKVNELIAIHSQYTFDETCQHVANLQQKHPDEQLRLCCYATVGNTSINHVSFLTAKLINKLLPNALLIITTNDSQEDTAKYLNRKKTQRKFQLPMIEMAGISINASILYGPQKINYNKLNLQISDPTLLPTYLTHANKVLIIYIFDSFYNQDELFSSNLSEEPYLTVYYDEINDTYIMKELNLHKKYTFSNTEMNVEELIINIIGLTKKHNLTKEKITLCCPAHLGSQNGEFINTHQHIYEKNDVQDYSDYYPSDDSQQLSDYDYTYAEKSLIVKLNAQQQIVRSLCITEILSNLVNKMLPTTLLLLTSNPEELDDAQRYLERKFTKLRYLLPNISMCGNVFDTQNDPPTGLLASIIEAPNLPHKIRNRLKVFSIYITHHIPDVFFIKTLAAAHSSSKKQPYIIIYYNIEIDMYSIREVSTFSRQQFCFSPKPTTKELLIEDIQQIQKELNIKKLEMYTHTNLGNPQGEFVTTECDYWIINLEPKFIGLFYIENSKDDTLLYYRHASTAHGIKLPTRNLSGICINETAIQASFARGIVEPEVIEAMVYNSPIIPNFFKNQEKISIYLFQNNPTDQLNIETLMSFCGGLLNLPSILIYYSRKDDSFLVNKINLQGQSLIIPNYQHMQTNSLIKFINIIKISNGGLLRLYCQANLGQYKSYQISPLLNYIIHQIQPFSLYLFHTKFNQLEAEAYLMRRPTAAKLSLPDIDMRGCCLNEDDIRHAIEKDRNDTEASNYLIKKLLQEAPMLNSPASSYSRNSRFSLRYFLRLFSCSSSTQIAPSNAISNSRTINQPTPLRISISASFSSKTSTPLKHFCFNEKVSVLEYDPRTPINDYCGFMKISTSTDSTCTLKDILRSFNYNRGLLFYRYQIIYININYFLGQDLDALFDEILFAETTQSHKICIPITSTNQPYIEQLMNFFESLNDEQYISARDYYSCGLFQAITGEHMHQIPTNSTTPLTYKQTRGHMRKIS